MLQTIDLPKQLRVGVVSETVSSQPALVIEDIPIDPFSIQFGFALCNEPDLVDRNEAVFTRLDNPFTAADQHLSEHVSNSLDNNLNNKKALEALLRLVPCMFNYSDKKGTLNLPAFCDLKTHGNCIDINTVFLSSLYCAEIRSAYLAGFFFSEVIEEKVANGMHCWMSTWLDDKISHWDIAQSLINNVNYPMEGLNQFGGLRVAFSYGRGLEFSTKWGKTRPISHFAKPHWLFLGLSVQEANIEVRLMDLSAKEAEVEVPQSTSKTT